MDSTTRANSRIDPRCQVDFPAEEFAARRERILDAIEGEGYALLQSAPAPRGCVDFRQSNLKQFAAGEKDVYELRETIRYSGRVLGSLHKVSDPQYTEEEKCLSAAYHMQGSHVRD